MHEFEEYVEWKDEYEVMDEDEDLQIMTLKNCTRESAGAIVGRTPFLLFVGTWDNNKVDSNGKSQSKERAIEKMKAILLSSQKKEFDARYVSDTSRSGRLVGTGDIRLGNSMKEGAGCGDGLYAMLFASTFHPEYIYACQRKAELDAEDMKQILKRKRAINAGIEPPNDPHTDHENLSDKKEINKIKHDLMNRRVTYLVMILALWTF